MSWLAQHDGRELTAVTIAPDLGERYLDTVYQTNWLKDLYGEDVLSSDTPTVRPMQPEPRHRSRRHALQVPSELS